MKAFIASLLFLALLGIRIPASFAQQDQSYQKLAQEMESLRTQLSAVQSQLQTVENVEKIELTAKLAEAQAKLTDANAKLMNTQFGKFERELKNSYDDWLQTWTLVFLTVVGVSVAILFGVSRAYWYWLSSKTEKLIGDGVEEKINGFMEAIDQVNILENKVKVLDKEHAAEMLGRFIGYPFTGEDAPGQIKELKVEALLDVLRDETRHPDIKVRAVQVLTGRQSPRLVSPVLELLNSTLDSHQDKELSLPIAGPPKCLSKSSGIYLHTGDL